MTDALRALGWAVCHSLWLGAIVVALAAPCLQAFSSRRPRRAVWIAWTALASVSLAFALPLALRPDGSLDGRGLASWLGVDGTGDAAAAAWVDGAAVALGAAWSAGFAAVIAFGALGRARVRRWLRRSRRVDPRRLLGDRCWPELCRVRLHLVRGGPSGPCVAGWRHPTVLVPIRSVRLLGQPRLAAVLAHEEGHLMRRDPLTAAAARALGAVVFFHPAAWWLRRRLACERELCCDDLAVARCGDARLLALGLAALATSESTPVLAARAAPLLPRLARLLAPRAPRRAWRWTAALGPVLACAAIAAGAYTCGLQARAARDRTLPDAPWLRVLGVGRPILQVAPGIALGDQPGTSGGPGCLVVFGRDARIRRGGQPVRPGARVAGGECVTVEVPGRGAVQLALDRVAEHGRLSLKAKWPGGAWGAIPLGSTAGDAPDGDRP